MGATLSTDRRLLLLSVPVAVATGVVAFWWMRKQRARTYLQVGFVSALNVYPVKSCRAISLEHAECLVTGIKYDRYSIVYTLKSQPRVVLCFVYSATAYRQRQRGSYRGRNQMAISTLKGVHSHAMRWLQRLNGYGFHTPFIWWTWYAPNNAWVLRHNRRRSKTNTFMVIYINLPKICSRRSFFSIPVQFSGSLPGQLCCFGANGTETKVIRLPDRQPCCELWLLKIL